MPGTGNPALNANTFSSVNWSSGSAEMTLNGTVGKSALLLAVISGSAFWVWNTYTTTHNPALIMPQLLIGAIGGFIVAMVTIFKKEWSPVTAPVYAALEGLALGGISVVLNDQYPGIVFQAVGLTFSTLAALLMTYTTGLIKPSENFKLGIVAATGGIAILYVIDIVMHFFHMSIPFIHESGPWGIAFSGFVVVIAALNLVLDFDFIDQGVQNRAPKYMEWYAAFGLMVTLVWLYLEILRLLAKIRRSK